MLVSLPRTFTFFFSYNIAIIQSLQFLLSLSLRLLFFPILHRTRAGALVLDTRTRTACTSAPGTSANRTRPCFCAASPNYCRAISTFSTVIRSKPRCARPLAGRLLDGGGGGRRRWPRCSYCRSSSTLRERACGQGFGKCNPIFRSTRYKTPGNLGDQSIHSLSHPVVFFCFCFMSTLDPSSPPPSPPPPPTLERIACYCIWTFTMCYTTIASQCELVGIKKGKI